MDVQGLIIVNDILYGISDEIDPVTISENVMIGDPSIEWTPDLTTDDIIEQNLEFLVNEMDDED